MSYKDITTSALLGEATGDALGVPVEFLSRAEVRAIGLTDMIGKDTPITFSSRWGDLIPAGAWSDDTSMTIAGMASIANLGGCIDWEDIMCEYLTWWTRGEYCSINYPFGLGGTIDRAFRQYAFGYPATECGPCGEYDNGNGALMRILPFSLYCIFSQLDDNKTVSIIDTASSLTHGHPISKMGCLIFTLFLRNLLTMDVQSAWEATRRFEYAAYYDNTCLDAYKALLSNHFSEKDIAESGYVVDTITTAVYSMIHSHNYESAVLCAISMGYDTDTNAAVTGALAGVYYGVSAIPKRWTAKLQKKGLLRKIASDFARQWTRR